MFKKFIIFTLFAFTNCADLVSNENLNDILHGAGKPSPSIPGMTEQVSDAKVRENIRDMVRNANANPSLQPIVKKTEADKSELLSIPDNKQPKPRGLSVMRVTPQPILQPNLQPIIDSVDKIANDNLDYGGNDNPLAQVLDQSSSGITSSESEPESESEREPERVLERELEREPEREPERVPERIPERVLEPEPEPQPEPEVEPEPPGPAPIPPPTIRPPPAIRPLPQRPPPSPESSMTSYPKDKVVVIPSSDQNDPKYIISHSALLNIVRQAIADDHKSHEVVKTERKVKTKPTNHHHRHKHSKRKSSDNLGSNRGQMVSVKTTVTKTRLADDSLEFPKSNEHRKHVHNV